MSALLSIVLLGFFLGMRHATDSDHMVAVSAIVTRQRTPRGALLVGALWGLGHTITIVLVGGTLVLFTVAIPPRLGLVLELGVALMLIVLGATNLASLGRGPGGSREPPGVGPAHAHPHAHNDYYVHSHLHGHGPGEHGHGEDETPTGRLDRRFGGLGVYQVLRPLVVGLVHGLAGSAAAALLVLTSIRNPLWAAAYLLVFGAGTLAGMMLMTATVAVPLAYTACRFERVRPHLVTASGFLSVALGLVLAYQAGFVGGLLTGRPRWMPQ